MGGDSLNNIFKDQRLNYKDFLIIIASWYFIRISSYYIIEKDFVNLIYINQILSFTISILSHIVFLLIIYSYFNLLYDLKFSDLGFKLNKEQIRLKLLSIIFIILTSGVILFNFNYSNATKSSFFPINLTENFLKIIYSNLPLIVIIFLTLIFTASVEQFLINKITFSLFDLYLPSFIAIILNSLFASILLLEFESAFILINFFALLISNYLYLISDYTLFNSIIFYSYFLTIYIVFIYGFQFIII